MGVRKSVYRVGIKTAQRCGIFVTICMSDMYFKRIAAFIRAEAIRPPHGIAYLKIKKYLAGEASCHGEGYPPYSPLLFYCLQVFSFRVYSTAVCACCGVFTFVAVALPSAAGVPRQASPTDCSRHNLKVISNITRNVAAA